MEERSSNPGLEPDDLFPPKPDPGPPPPKVPGPIPWIAGETGQAASSRAKVLALPQESGPTTRAAGPFVSCFWCERLHRGAHPLAVCADCVESFSTLRSLEMSGSYPLSDAAIDETVTQTAPGNYALGYLVGETFSVYYVGRSDSDLKRRLHEWVGMPSGHGAYGSDAKAAWALHRRGPLALDAPILGRVTCAAGGYTHFAFCYAESSEEAYAREWRNYDAFGGRHGLDNESQPLSPARSTG